MGSLASDSRLSICSTRANAFGSAGARGSVIGPASTRDNLERAQTMVMHAMPVAMEHEVDATCEHGHQSPATVEMLVARDAFQPPMRAPRIRQAAARVGGDA